MTDTDRATERLAEALRDCGREWYGEGFSEKQEQAAAWSRASGQPTKAQFYSDRLTAQGFGHRDDILRAFAEWLIEGNFAELDTTEGYPDFRGFANDFIASLAAKGEEE